MHFIDKTLKLTVCRLDRDADFRGGIFFGLNVFPNSGIFRDFLRSLTKDGTSMNDPVTLTLQFEFTVVAMRR